MQGCLCTEIVRVGWKRLPPLHVCSRLRVEGWGLWSCLFPNLCVNFLQTAVNKSLQIHNVTPRRSVAWPFASTVQRSSNPSENESTYLYKSVIRHSTNSRAMRVNKCYIVRTRRRSFFFLVLQQCTVLRDFFPSSSKLSMGEYEFDKIPLYPQ